MKLKSKQEKTGDEHLMIDDSMLEKICGYANLSKKDSVIEVGAGTGNLTEKLSAKAGMVYAIEKEDQMFEELSRRLAGGNVELIHADATKIPFPKYSKIVSNLPYSISRKITKKFLLHGFDSAVLVYQKEFADKLTAKVGSDHYRMITALAQSTCKIELLDSISPEAFIPQPNVWSRIVRLTMKEKPTPEYAEFLQELFNHKNKHVKNTIKDVPKEYATKKPCEMKPEEFISLYGEYHTQR